MNLHEYQAKEYFEIYDLPVSKRSIIKKSSDIDEAIESIDFSNGCVAKVQSHTGGRGKVGGVKLCKSKVEVEEFVEKPDTAMAEEFFKSRNIQKSENQKAYLNKNLLDNEDLKRLSTIKH